MQPKEVSQMFFKMFQSNQERIEPIKPLSLSEREHNIMYTVFHALCRYIISFLCKAAPKCNVIMLYVPIWRDTADFILM